MIKFSAKISNKKNKTKAKLSMYNEKLTYQSFGEIKIFQLKKKVGC